MTNKVSDLIYSVQDTLDSEKRELFKVVSTFAGGGGSSTGYRLAGGKVLAINEFVEEARKTYAKNFPDTKIYSEDIRSLTGHEILRDFNLKRGELDIFDGSPPCASFSMAGSREKGWGKVKKYSDTSQRADDLFFEYARLLEVLQPKVFIAENVKGITIGKAKELLGSNQMNMFDSQEDTILHTLINCGYKVRFKVLSADHYGVPQARTRTIFIGVRDDINAQPTYPKRRKPIINIRDAFADLVITEEEKPYTTPDTMAYDLYPNVEVGDSFEAAVIAMYGKKGWFSKQKLNPDRTAPTITTKPDDFFHWSERRNFSLQEVKRLMSLPYDYAFANHDKFRKNFERCGRMVPPLMMKAVAEHLYKTVLKPLKEGKLSSNYIDRPIQLRANDTVKSYEESGTVTPEAYTKVQSRFIKVDAQQFIFDYNENASALFDCFYE